MKKLIAVIVVFMILLTLPGAALAGCNMVVGSWTVGEIEAGGGGIAFPGYHIAGGVAIIFALIIYVYGEDPGPDAEIGQAWR